jgi:hypothetical protein
MFSISSFSQELRSPENPVRFKPICASATWMGNRGEIHDHKGEIVRQFKTKSWVTCRLSYKGWSRKPLMQPGRYTELFFLDEATALSAGHRPCAMCRNAEYASFKTHWLRANGFAPGTAVTEIDKAMHEERMGRSGSDAWQQSLGSLPCGVVIVFNETSCLWSGGRLFQWTNTGYVRNVLPCGDSASVRLLTPPSVVNAIRDGYRVQVHASADVFLPQN